jgi:phage repressor protein C with HTH and peptisase S24 domain
MSKKYADGIGGRIAEIRGDLSQEEFGEQHGASRSRVSDYESGRSQPDLKFLVSISNKTGYALEWIITGEGKKKYLGQVYSYTKDLSIEPLSIKESNQHFNINPQLRLVATVPAGLGEITDRSEWHEWMSIDFNPEKDVVLEVSKENGESMIPFVNVGDYAIITDSIKVKSGDLVAALWTKHAGALKVYDEQNGNAILLSYNPLHTPIILPKSKVKLYFVKSIIKRRK